MSDLEPIRRVPLYEEVAQRVREFVGMQGLEPGDKLLSERELAHRLGVSRTSVRQALTALRVSGLVDIRHGDGVYLLRKPDDPAAAPGPLGLRADLPTIMEVREALETQTARLSARRRTQADLVAMRGALRAMAAAIDQGDDGASADRRFHAAIVEASRNELLAGLVDQLAAAIDRTRHAALSRPGRPPRALASDQAILDAIDRRDEIGAAEAMRAHLAGPPFVAEEDLP